jgi:hypothetical protein
VKRLIAIAALSLSLIAPSAVSAHPTSTGHLTRVVAAKSCSSGYVKGTIGGVVKCLRAGEYCTIKYKAQYVKYGFKCSGSPARLHKR